MFDFELIEDHAFYAMSYRFPKRGDGIGMHTHEESQKHNVIVLRGSIEIYGPDKLWKITMRAGDVLALGDDKHPHEIAALEDDTKILGVFIHGKPDGEFIPEEHRRGTITRKPITIPL